jgi:hypothetical protein
MENMKTKTGSIIHALEIVMKKIAESREKYQIMNFLELSQL